MFSTLIGRVQTLLAAPSGPAAPIETQIGPAPLWGPGRPAKPGGPWLRYTRAGRVRGQQRT